jgi:hypothetical protein
MLKNVYSPVELKVSRYVRQARAHVVSAVAIKLIKFQFFEKFQNTFLGGFFSVISAIAEALWAKRQMNVYCFSSMFSFIF